MERTYDKPRFQKLGIRPGARVAIMGVPDDDFRAEVAAWTDDVTFGPPGPATDLIFLAADGPADLGRLADLRRSLKRDGAIWVVSRKGRAATMRDTEVMAAGVASGLVDNKVVAFSTTHTALRLVIPLALRPDHPA